MKIIVLFSLIPQKSLPIEFNVEAMKRVLAEPTERSKRDAKEKEQQLLKTFREDSFDELMRRTEPKHDVIQNRLNDIFNSLGNERPSSQIELKNKRAIYENNFPELFFY